MKASGRRIKTDRRREDCRLCVLLCAGNPGKYGLEPHLPTARLFEACFAALITCSRCRETWVLERQVYCNLSVSSELRTPPRKNSSGKIALQF